MIDQRIQSFNFPTIGKQSLGKIHFENFFYQQKYVGNHSIASWYSWRVTQCTRNSKFLSAINFEKWICESRRCGSRRSSSFEETLQKWCSESKKEWKITWKTCEIWSHFREKHLSLGKYWWYFQLWTFYRNQLQKHSCKWRSTKGIQTSSRKISCWKKGKRRKRGFEEGKRRPIAKEIKKRRKEVQNVVMIY